MLEDEISAIELKNKPEVIGQFAGKSLIVTGSARCLWDDLLPYRDSDWGKTDVMAINENGIFLPLPVKHWSGLHPDYFIGYRNLRPCYAKFYELKDSPIFHACHNIPGVDVYWQSEKFGGGSSAWNATVYGVLMGYNSIILCGVPLDDTGHFFDPPWPNLKICEYDNIKNYYQRVWKWAEDNIFKGRVKSMSGLTREICGSP